MVITTYRCDTCGAESTNHEELDLKVVAIGIRCENSFSHTFNLLDKQRREKSMCKTCRRECGLEEAPISSEMKGLPMPIYPSLEEMVRRICREEIIENKEVS